MTTEANNRSFKSMIGDGTIKRADAMKVRYQDIHVEPGFNLRDENDDFQASVRILADYIKEGGIYPPLEVRVRQEGGVWIVDGHRRHAALGIAIAEGAPIEWVEIRQFVGNDADRTARIITSAEGRPLTVLEQSRGYKRLAAFGWSNGDIARKMGKTATHVENLLILANANSDVHALVTQGAVSATLAIQTVRQKGERAGHFLKAHVDAARAEGKTKATHKTINGRAYTQEEAKSLLRGVEQMLKAIPEDAREALDGARAENKGSASIPVPAWVILHLEDIRATIKER